MLDRVNLVFPVSAALDDHGPRFDRVDVHQVHVEPIRDQSIDQCRHVLGHAGPSPVRVEVPEPAV